MHDVCVGYLDRSVDVDHPLVAEKTKQLTRLSVTRHLQAPSNYEATTVDDILNWFKTQFSSRYLVIIKYGVILDDFQIVINSIQELSRSNGVIKGRLVMKDGAWYLDDSFLIVDRVRYESMFTPSWGEHHMPYESFIATLDKGPYGTHELNATPDRIHVKSPPMGGWNLIHRSLLSGKTVIHLGLSDMDSLYYLEPTAGTSLLAEAFYDFATVKSSIVPRDQYDFLSRHSYGSSSLGSSVDVFDSRPTKPVCGGSPMVIQNLYSLASGFRPLQILKHHGFRDDTTVTYLDLSEQALVFRRCMVNDWDGINYPRFAHRVINHHKLKVSRSEPDWEQAWQDVLQTFGGPREFKVLWDRYRKLKHTYVITDFLGLPDYQFTEFSQSPQSYLWFGNAFCNYDAHVDSSQLDLDLSFKEFKELVKRKNSRMILDGCDSYGRFV
jgi:hypothetical protein